MPRRVRSLLACTLASLLTLVLVAASPARADDETVQFGSVAFPARVDALERRGTRDFESKEPGYGLGIAYRGGDTSSDIYIYDRQKPQIPVDPNAAMVINEIDLALDEIQAAVRQGIYQSALVQKRYQLRGPDGGILYNVAALTIVRDATARDSFVMVTTRNAKFFKVRYTTPSHDGSAAEAERFALSLLR